ncbi:MAG: SMP-30/gluconolactonase/LRE family protein [Novosphingobium sp.]|nr:SMP-30/gluconolactonase/LRE family protein [Novosphingobium sp.]MCP5403823.1 SMP-30/gluconolactonase/LRE family protein [Novosphingobium sp.]
MDVTRIDCYCRLGEGPVWDVQAQSLFFLDIAGGMIHRYRPSDESFARWDTPNGPGAMALHQDGGAIVAMQDTLYEMNFDTGAFKPLIVADTQHPDAVFNDGKVDRQGRFIIGSCSTRRNDPERIGGIYRLGLAGDLQRVGDDIQSSNSPCFAPDGKTLYFSDSARHTIYSYEYDPATGDLGSRAIFADTSSLGGMPDGATVDSDGLIWVAIIRGAKVVAFRPNGKIERIVELPVGLPGSVMFGGEDLDRLFVPTIDPAYFGEPTHEGAGYLYVVDGLGSRGLPEPRFAGMTISAS